MFAASPLPFTLYPFSIPFHSPAADGTMSGLMEDIRKATMALKNSTSAVSVASGCELFVRFITLTKELDSVRSMQQCA